MMNGVEVLLYYPEMPVLEALALAGIDPAVLGKERLAKVKRNLDLSYAHIHASQRRERIQAGQGATPARDNLQRKLSTRYPHVIHKIRSSYPHSLEGVRRCDSCPL